MPTTQRRERERQERRAAILDAAERVFGEKGFLAATMDEIAAEAELSKGALYLYFKNKDELFLGHSVRPLEALGQRLTCQVDRGLPGLETLRAVLCAYAGFAEDHPRDFLNGMQWVLAGSEVDPATLSFQAHSTCIGRLLGAFVAAVERGRADGTIRPDLEPVQTGARLWCALIGALIVRINTARMVKSLPHELPLKNTDILVPELIEILCRGVNADPEATPTPAPSSKSRS